MKPISCLVFVLFLVFLFSCREDCDEPCPSCPLSTGENCTNGHINVNDSCVCPEGTFDYGVACRELNKGGFYYNINCLCFDALSIGFQRETGILGYNVARNGRIPVAGLGGFGGDSTDFIIRFWDWKCRLPTGELASPWLIGGVSDDTMSFDIEWHFFYWIDSTGQVFLSEPDSGEYVPPLGYLDSTSTYSCGGTYTAIREK